MPAQRYPKPADIQAARQAADLTQAAAGDLLHTTARVWRQWEAGDARMHPAFWELFQLKTGGRHVATR
ncbi:MAG TPA: helix-turn-helix transcriptional regulator [Vicinamibacterales bacterium]|nr:helix-turn-helix transcriptional regulator [Vicinamibacterales bacterium]